MLEFWQLSPLQQQLTIKLEKIRNAKSYAENGIGLLVELFQKIRPGSYWNHEQAQQQLSFLIDILKNDSDLCEHFVSLINYVFLNSDISEVLTESGILNERSFFYEFNKRIRHKLLPPLKNKNSFLYAINTIFYKHNDYKWIECIDNNVWIELFELMRLDFDISNQNIMIQLTKSLYIISSRISSLGTEPDIRRCFNSEELYAFINQFKALQSLIEERQNIPNKNEHGKLEQKLFYELNTCESLVNSIQANTAKYGTSLHQNYIVMRLKKLIDRMRMVVDIVNSDDKVDVLRIITHFKDIVENENTENSIRMLIRENVEFVAYRIAEHERDTGEHYITATRAEYWKMFKSAMGGGFIISFIAVIKNLFHFIKMAPFWQGFAFSINYAVGFISIYATGATLATKQPAMTASAIASSLDSKKSDKPNLAELAILVSETVRSQTVSFIGNLIIVFPLTLGIAYLWNLIFGFNIAEEETAQALLDAQNPIKSLSILYACFTGVFLYLSGIISGYFDNLAVYGNIPQRLREHPGLKRTLPQRYIDKIANYASKHLGGLMGNLSLGFFLGMAGFIGYIFGINFDIRHITVSTGNFAIGLQGLGFNVTTADLIWTTVGVLLIGFFNFLVSFALAFFTALASRKIRFRHYRRFGRFLLRLFIRYPLDFIRPPKSQRQPKDFVRYRAFTQKEITRE
ncbi:MAG: site-specific recombinase [Prevotellaceae bacterium]|jgi:site-specific recombinase|nr:site-specific recombinase [Prevotellaceae bacterium]